MVAINRGPGVVGWDPASSKPKGVVSPSEHRGGLTALAQHAGVFYTDGTDAAIGTSTSSRQLTVAPAGVAISSPLGGWYLPWWSSTLTITPAPAGSQARIDVIYAQQADYELDGTSVDSAAVVDIKQGQPSATPTAPTLDERQLALYQVRVPAGVTNSAAFIITKVFKWTFPVGADVVADTLAQLNGISSPSGQRARVIADPTTANNGDYVRTSGAWVRTTPIDVPVTQYWGNGGTGGLKAQLFDGVVTVSGGFNVGATGVGSISIATLGIPPQNAVPTVIAIGPDEALMICNITSAGILRNSYPTKVTGDFWIPNLTYCA